jgi:two-component system, NarL family, nitrate/nitrite response regulator NarL
MRSSLKVLVADDHPVFRLGLGMALRQLGFGHVVEAEDGEAALRACADGLVDIAVLDVKMPRMNGLEVIRAAREAAPAGIAPPIFIIMSAFDQPAVVKAGGDLEIGAFLGKETTPGRLAAVIDSLVAGRSVGRQADSLRLEELTRRERQVLRLLCLGKPTKAIAAALELSTETAKDHLTRVYAKLGVRERAAAVAAAHRLGWTTLLDLGVGSQDQEDGS